MARQPRAIARSLRRWAAAAPLAALAACGGGGDATPSGNVVEPPATQTSTAVAFQGDASHAGIASATTPSFPLVPSWQRTFASTVSYPLIAEGKVFVVVSEPSNSPPQLLAINQSSGLDEWRAVIGNAFAASHAYDGGRIFVVGSDNIVRAFDAATGSPVWSTLLPTYGQGGLPVARNGRVYVSTGNTVAALDERSGAIAWSKPAQSYAPVTLGADSVFTVSSCGGAAALLQASGLDAWRVAPDAACGTAYSTDAPAYAGGRVYLRDHNYSTGESTLAARDAGTGALVRSFASADSYAIPIPAVSADAVYLLNGGTLQRLDPTLQTVAWSFAGDGSLRSAPLVVGGAVFVGGYNGRLYAVDAATGAERWSALVPAGLESQEYSIVTGMAAANGILVAPNGRNLSTWRLAVP